MCQFETKPANVGGAVIKNLSHVSSNIRDCKLRDVSYRRHGVVVRASASQSVDQGLFPLSSRTKRL